MVSQPDAAGVPRHVADLAVAIAALGWQVTVATPVGSAAWRDLDGRPAIALLPFTGRRAPHPSDLLWLLRLLRAVRSADVVHTHSSKAGFLGRFACLLTRRRARCVFTPHGWSFWSATGARRRLYLWLERLAAPWCARIIAVSAYERDAALAARVGRAEQYTVVRNGVPTERFATEPAAQPGVVVMVARLAPPKRADLVVRAAALLRDRGIDIRLQLVGGGPLLEQTRSVIAECGAAAYVDLLGDRDDVPALLAAASCFVLASDYEGCPLSVLEAMAAGLPVVVTRVGGIDEVVTPSTGLVVEPSAAALADGIAAMLADPAAAAALGAAGRAAAIENFTTARMAADVAAVYAAL
jgi:glycosyltransferase involved in cell wall biosynthesis